MPVTGVRIRSLSRKSRFDKDLRKLDPIIVEQVKEALNDLLKNPIPPGRRPEKIEGTDFYSIRVNRNFRISFELDSDVAVLRRVAAHDKLYSNP